MDGEIIQIYYSVTDLREVGLFFKRRHDIDLLAGHRNEIRITNNSFWAKFFFFIVVVRQRYHSLNGRSKK